MSGGILLCKITLAVLATGVCLSVVAATITYKDDVYTGEWSNADNWLIDGQPAGRVPEDGDDVVIGATKADKYGQDWNAGQGEQISLRTSTPKLNSLTLGKDRVLGVFGWNSCIQVKTVTVAGTKGNYAFIRPGGSWSSAHSFVNGAESNRVYIAAETVNLGQYSGIWAIARGYAGGNGPGWAGVTSKAGAGAYGGRQGMIFEDGKGGFDFSGVKECKPYGSIRHPTDPGSGSVNTGAEYNSGGAVRIVCTNLTIASTAYIKANSYCNCDYGPIGSGGSIWISCSTVSGSGPITANGADMSGPSAVHSGCGGGGGGRIAIDYDPAKQKDVDFTSVIEARGSVCFLWNGASEKSETRSQRPRENGHCGTVWFTDDLIMKRPGIGVKGRVYTGESVTPYQLPTAQDLVLTNAFFEYDEDNLTVAFAGNVTVSGSETTMNGFRFNGTNIHFSVGGDLTLEGGSVRLGAGGSVNVAGNATLQDGTWHRTAGEIYVCASPTNFPGAADTTVTVGKKLSIGAYSVLLCECDFTNGAAVVTTVGSLSVSSNGWIDAIETGLGKGKGTGLANDFRKGSAHGGLGGTHPQDAGGSRGGTLYGDWKRPVLPGSSAPGTSTTVKQRGGGVIRIKSEGNMTIDGTVAADGWGRRGGDQGASSGGSVLLDCGGVFRGAGRITADGGINPDTKYKGQGGGGRVAIYARTFCTNDTFQARALGGGQVYGEPEDDVNWHGGNGTIYLRMRKGFMMVLR